MSNPGAERPKLVSAIAIFFAFGATMSALTVVLLVFPGTLLDILWRLNSRAQTFFIVVRGPAVLLMACVSVACAVAAVGLWRVRRFGLILAVAILAINMTGDCVNAFVLHEYRALIGVPIGGAMVGYLISRRRSFE